MFNKEHIDLLARVAGMEEKDEFSEDVAEGMPEELTNILKQKKQFEKQQALQDVAEVIWDIRKKAIQLRQQLVTEIRELRRKERAKLAKIRELEATLESTKHNVNYLPLLAIVQPGLQGDITKALVNCIDSE